MYFFFTPKVSTGKEEMADLEQLTNNQLRDELKKNGLGNFPVTDTTRKLLIRKLRNTLEGKTAPAAKTRRETVHVPKIVDDSESDRETTTVKTKTTTNRRATIAAQPAVVKEVKSKPIVEPKKSGRTTPLLPPTNSIFSRNTVDITENSDDDLVAQNSQPVRNRRTSRSPSLGKSTVVTTSYKHTIEPLNELDADDDIEDDDLILLNDVNDRGSPSSGNGLTSSERVNQFANTFNWSKPSVDRRTTYDGNINYTSPLPKSGNTYYDKSREETTTETFKRRYTTNAIRKNTEEEDDDDADNILSKHDTPFLSNFTRRLAELKAEPLPSLSRTVEREKLPTSSYRSQSTYYRDYTTSPLGRRYHETKTDTVWESFKNFLKAFERKVRWPFLILVALLALIFIYVFLFTN